MNNAKSKTNDSSSKFDSFSLEIARDDTDASLETERLKTDESFAKETSEANRETDRDLQSDRKERDKKQEIAREARDFAIDETRDTNTEEKGEQKRLEDHLQQERKRSDASKKIERMAADATLILERKKARLTAEAFLILERESTDADLLAERTQTDQEAERTNQYLSEEEKAHQTTKATLSSREEILAVVSHDLRNPLNSIAMSAEILASNLRKTKSDENLELVSMIQRNAAMMDRLITDLLEVERMETGGVQLNLSKQSIESLLEDCENLFGIIARKKSIELKMSVVNGPLFAIFDQERISQVLSNLVGNALKFTPAGGRVSLEARPAAEKVEITVADTGPGIPVGEQNKIFEKFSQIDKSSRQGLGLGLYISRWIIGAHGGKISLQSSPGKGTSFSFEI